MRSAQNSRGFTLVELLTVIVVLLLVGVGAAVLIDGIFPRRRGCGGYVKDPTQVRAIQQALVVWANQNGGKYPLPSEIDAANFTIDAPASSKDTTANILSALIWSGYISTDILISPAESNIEGIEQDPDYELDAPKAAHVPAKALWDPAFSADFTSPQGGNVSYAHLQPASERRQLWADNFTTTLPIISNRGPEITNVTYHPKTAAPSFTYANPNSNTFLIHGSRTTWEGNVAYNDGHVSFEVNPAPESGRRISVGGSLVRDTFFYDETDPAAARNAFLGIFTSAGDTLADFTAIWD